MATVIVLPNINQVLQSPMKPYDVSSISTITYVVVLAVVLLLIGFYKTKRESIWR